MSKKTLGQLIRKLRKQKGLSLRNLAEQVDVSYVQIAHIENGKFSTSKRIFEQLAKALDYDVDKLLAAGDAVGDDIEKIITKTPTAVPEFLRTAKNLTEDDWRSLTEQVKNMNKKKK
jgi:transcriptional regulator with XRE-family HTH domain